MITDQLSLKSGKLPNGSNEGKYLKEHLSLIRAKLWDPFLCILVRCRDNSMMYKYNSSFFLARKHSTVYKKNSQRPPSYVFRIHLFWKGRKIRHLIIFALKFDYFCKITFYLLEKRWKFSVIKSFTEMTPLGCIKLNYKNCIPLRSGNKICFQKKTWRKKRSSKLIK